MMRAQTPRGLRFSAHSQAGYTIAALRGDLDIGCAPVLREQLLGVLGPRANRLVIDLSEVGFCDASGLAVLVGTARRARLLGGVMRLAAPTPAVAATLRITGLDRQLLVFSTVSAAISNARARRPVPVGTVRNPRLPRAPGARRKSAALALGVAARGLDDLHRPDPDDLHRVVTALLAHADEWRDADPNRRLTPTLRTLARAHAGTNHTALADAARSLLSALIRHPLTYSPAVAATARDLRRLVESSSHRPALN